MQPTRYIVVDLNIFEEPQVFRECVRDNDQVVVVNALLGDVAGSDSDRFSRHLDQFPKWYQERGTQIWIPKAWQDLVMAESSTKSRTVGLSWRNDLLSHEIRTIACDSPERFQQRLREIRDANAYQVNEKQRSTFIRICREFASFCKSRLPDKVDRWRVNLDGEAVVESAQSPALGSAWARKLSRSRNSFTDPGFRKILGEIERLQSWRQALERFPDVKAIGRMGRIWCWYGMMLAVGADKKFENNFEDAEYGFAASYTKYLATKDKGLRRMVRNLFPQVTLWPPDEAATC